MDSLLLTIGNTVNDLVVLAATNNFIDQLKDFIEPFLIGAVAIMSITFIAKRQFMQLIVFLVFAIVVFALFYGGEFLANIGKSAGDSAKEITWD